jgi:hypothetical protein
MKQKYGSVLFAVTMLAGVSAFAANTKGGGGVPSPFTAASNHRVELADSETYTLSGKVVFDNTDSPFFWVDLRKHPWLANAKREQSPYYRLAGTRDQWRQYQEKSVELMCTAKGVINGASYDIILVPVLDEPSKAVILRDR